MKRLIAAAVLALAMCLAACSNEREDLTTKMTDSLKITAYVLNSDYEGKGYWKYDGTHEHKNKGYWVSDDGTEYDGTDVFVKERLELGKPRILAPFGYDYQENLNIWLDSDGVIEVDTDPLNDDRIHLAYSLDNPDNPTLGHRTEANAFRALAPTAVNVCPLGRFFEGPGLVTSYTLVGETYYINVRTYDHEGTQIITAKLKLTAIEDPDEEYGRMEKVMFYGDGEDVSRFMTIELIEYDYSDVYKLDEYYESR